MGSYVPEQKAPTDSGPVVFDRPSAERTRDAVLYVEGFYRGGKPLRGRGLKSWSNPGRWAFLAASATITAASGATLGSGTVRLCSRSGPTLTADGDFVTVYNAGGAVTAGGSGKYLKLGWTDGDWGLDVAPCS
jgi:hypothetical protein